MLDLGHLVPALVFFIAPIFSSTKADGGAGSRWGALLASTLIFGVCVAVFIQVPIGDSALKRIPSLYGAHSVTARRAVNGFQLARSARVLSLRDSSYNLGMLAGLKVS